MAHDWTTPLVTISRLRPNRWRVACLPGATAPNAHPLAEEFPRTAQAAHDLAVEWARKYGAMIQS